jgi:hypothetical protein
MVGLAVCPIPLEFMLLATLAPVLLALQSTAGQAPEGWSVASLQPPGVPVFDQSYEPVAVHSGLQSGHTWSGVYTPGYWQAGDGSTWQPLGSYATDAFVAGHWGADFVGFQSFFFSLSNFYENALLWRVTDPLGTPGVEEISLHPSGAFSSRALAIHAGDQGGFVALVSGQPRASLWSGSAASWTDLHPVGALKSQIEGMGPGQQVGYADFGAEHAGLWSGSAGSFTDLHPATVAGVPTLSSRALRCDGEAQVGYALMQGGSNLRRPLLWSGSAGSAQDLLPAGFTTGEARAVFDGRQAGYVRAGGSSRAILWNGSAGSHVDLGALLPPDGAGYSDSWAVDVWNDGTTWFVLGKALVVSEGTKPVLWSKPMVAAQETVRLGTPPNPEALLPGQTSGPVLGQTWDPRIDHTAFVPDAVLDLLLIAETPLNLPVPGAGTLLCSPSEFPIEFAAPGASFAIPVPDDYALVGAQLTSQGLSLDAADQLHGTNALDLVVGERQAP